MKKITIKKDEQVHVNTVEELRWVYDNFAHRWVWDIALEITCFNYYKDYRYVSLGDVSNDSLSIYRKRKAKKVIECSELMSSAQPKTFRGKVRGNS